MINRILTLPVGFNLSNIYFVENMEGECIMIDCGLYNEKVDYFIKSNELDVKCVLLTHSHYDHILGLDFAVRNHIDVYIGEKELPLFNDDELNLCARVHVTAPRVPDIKTLTEGYYNFIGFDVKVIETPGHTAGSVCYLIEDRLFTGDTMFFEAFGRCNFPTGDSEQMKASLDKLLLLDESIKVYPGHEEQTTIGHERAFYKKMQ